MKNSFKKIAFYVAATSGLLSAFVHGYLVQLHLSQRAGENHGTSVCSINDTFNCEAVSASQYSVFWGVPLALWGLAFNLLLVGYLFADRFVGGDKRSHRDRIHLLAFGIFGASIVMAGISLTQMSTYCLFCIFAYILSALTVIAIFFEFGKPSAQALSFNSVKGLATSVIVTSILTFVVGGAMTKSSMRPEMQQWISASIDDWQRSMPITMPVGYGIKKGADDTNAKMKIVEFADFGCSHCKVAANVLNAFVKSRSDVQLNFIVWPLDGECNDSIPQANGTRCLMTRAFYCAIQANKGWEAHSWLFDNQQLLTTKDAVQGKLEEMATATGLSILDLKECLDKPETQEKVRDMAKQGSNLKLTATPSFFVNGKKLEAGQTLEALERVHRLIQAEKK